MSENTNVFYTPSYINRLASWVGRLPGTSGVYYFGLGVILLTIQAAPAWHEGAVPVRIFLPIHIFLAAAISFIIAVIPFFDRQARSALQTIKPALNIDKDKYKELEYQLTNIPALKSILASFLILIFVYFSEFIGGGAYYLETLDGYPFSMHLSRGIYLICWWFFGVFIYHTIHQLSLINQIYTQYTLIDLFRMHPLYGFSNLAALTAGSLIMLPYGFLFINPNPTITLANPVVLSIYLSISIIAIITFLLPQLGIHRLQNTEQEHLLDEINQRYKATMREFHKRVDSGEFDEANNLNNTLSALRDQRETIHKISTWPWQPETIRWLFTAMVLPLLMWIVQYFLGQWLTS
jgi:hypothetical protein